MTLPQEIIRLKRDGLRLSEAEIAQFIAGLASGAVTEGQAAAFAMAVFFRGMDLTERIALTRAMTLSGETLDWRAPDLPGPVLDKHSTGGVGDNVSLMLAPMLAACGAFVPMISGRGLGHTGGTLDKLDSIPGYVTQPDLVTFKRVVREAGCAIIGQTDALAPADRRLYAIRDVTATVESVALITASILSKKLAAGLEGLVMDVKTGSGAFMPTLEGARELAESIATVATGAGLPTVSLITDMNEPLASAAGNAVEVKNAVDFLVGRRRDARLHRVTLALGARAPGARRAGEGRGRGGHAHAAHARFGGRRRALRAHGLRPSAVRATFSPTPRVRCPAQGLSPMRSPTGAASWRPSTCARWGSPWLSSAAAGRAPPTPSILRSASPTSRRSAPRSARARRSPGSTRAARTRPKPPHGGFGPPIDWATRRPSASIRSSRGSWRGRKPSPCGPRADACGWRCYSR